MESQSTGGVAMCWDECFADAEAQRVLTDPEVGGGILRIEPRAEMCLHERCRQYFVKSLVDGAFDASFQSCERSF
jgi:hypothetical protein